MAIFEWKSQDEDIFDSAIANSSPFKIVLKTKDDRWFIREWFEHHAGIVGPENIIIFDNWSTDADVMSFYEEISAATTIIRNKFAVNHIHGVERNRAFYAALACSCKHFCILDTDERLMMMSSPETVAPPSDIAPALASAPPDEFMPTLWLGNAYKSDKHLRISSETDFINALRWGKPIISTANIPDGFINHNCQLGQLTSKVAQTRFLLLHLKNLHPEQRISANLKKLENYGFIPEGTPAEEAINCDTTKVKKGDAAYWTSEIRNLLASKDAPEQRAQIMIEDGLISYSTDLARSLLASYFEDSSKFYGEAGITYLPKAALQA
jgi:hypothetical protein